MSLAAEADKRTPPPPVGKEPAKAEGIFTGRLTPPAVQWGKAMIEWLFKKAISSRPESYSPEQVKRILDTHRDTLVFCLLFLLIISVIFGGYIIFNEIRIARLKKQIEKKA